MSSDAASMRKDSHSATMYVAARSIAGMLLLVAYIVALRYYDQETQVPYVLGVLLVYESAIALGSLGLPDAVFYFIGRQPEKAAAIVRQTSALLLAAAVPVTVFAAIAAWVMTSPNVDLIAAIPWLALVILIELPTQPAVNQLIASGHAGTASALFLGFSILRTAAALAPLVLDIPLESIPIAMAVLGTTRLAAHVLILRKLFPMAPGEPWFDRKMLRTIFLFALPAGLAVTVGKLNPQIDKYVVKLMLGEQVFAEYSAAAIEIPMVTLIPYAIGAVMQVRFVRLYANGERAELARLWHATVKKTMVAVLPLAMVIIALAPDIISVLMTDKYARAVVPFQIFTAVTLHRVAAYGPMLQATNQTPLLFRTSLIILVTNLILTVPLTKLVGFNGAAIATVVANVPAWLLTLSRIGRKMGGGIRIALPWSYYLRGLIVTGLLAIALWIARPYLGERPSIRLGVGVSIYMAGYAIVGRLANFIHADDLWFIAGYFGLRRRTPPPPPAPPAPPTASPPPAS